MGLLAVVFNPTKVDVDELTEAVGKAEREHGWPPSLWFETSEDDPGCGMAQQAIAQGATVVLAAGGDGTVRGAAEGLRDSKTSLALLPAGTGNLLARNLGMDVTNPEYALALAFTGEDRPIDIGVADIFHADGEHERRAFLVMAGIGLDAQMIVNTDDDLKKKAGWLAYVKAIGASLSGGGQRLRMLVRLDKNYTFRTRAHTLLVGNCGELVGNVTLLPDARIDDGQLDLVTLRPKGVIGWVQIVWTVLVMHKILRRRDRGVRVAGKGSGHALRYRTAQRIDVRLPEPEAFELDGDLFGDVTAFTLQVDTLALAVKVPPPEPEDVA